MKNIKSFFKLLFIYSLVLFLVFSVNIKIDALNSNSNKNTKSDKIVKVDNNKQNKVQIEENVGKILDKYTGNTDNFEEKINSKDFFEICDIVGAMISIYTKATEDEQRKFNEYIEKSLKILKTESNSDFINEMERQYKILLNKEKYVNPYSAIYSVDKYPELFEHFSEEDLRTIDEYCKIGELLNNHSDSKVNYVEKMFSFYSKDALETFIKAMDIFDMVDDEEERDLLFGYIISVSPALEFDYPQRYSPELKERYENIKLRVRSRQANSHHMQMKMKNILLLMLEKPVSTLINTMKNIILSIRI